MSAEWHVFFYYNFSSFFSNFANLDLWREDISSLCWVTKLQYYVKIQQNCLIQFKFANSGLIFLRQVTTLKEVDWDMKNSLPSFLFKKNGWKTVHYDFLSPRRVMQFSRYSIGYLRSASASLPFFLSDHRLLHREHSVSFCTSVSVPSNKVVYRKKLENLA